MTELLNEITVLFVSRGKMAGTGERSLGMKETKKRRLKNKEGEERDENISFCALLAVLHSGAIISQAVLRALCSITGNTEALPP